MLQPFYLKIVSNLKLINFKKLVAEGSWIVLGQLVSVIASFVLVRVLTERLSTTEYGQLALGLTAATLVNQVIMGGLSSGIGRFYSVANEKGNLKRYIDASKHMLTLATLAVTCILVITVITFFMVDLQKWIPLLIAAMFYSILSGYNSTFNSIQNSARQRTVVAIHTTIDSILKIILIIGIFFIYKGTEITVINCYSVSLIVVTFSQYFFLKGLLNKQKEIKVVNNYNYEKDIWSYAWPICLAGLFNWGYIASQRWALELFVSTSYVGKFYALTQIAYAPVTMVGGVVLSFLTPILFAKVGDACDIDRVRKTQKLIFNIALVGFIIVIMVALISYFLKDIIFRVMVAPQFRSFSIYMPFMVISAGILQISILFSSILTISNKTKVFLPLSLFGNSLVALMNIYATKIWSVNGLVASMTIGSFIHLGWMLIIVHRHIKLTNKK